MKSLAEYEAVNALSSVIVTAIPAAVSPLLQLVKVRIGFEEAVSVTFVPSSYMFLPSTTVGAGVTATI